MPDDFDLFPDRKNLDPFAFGKEEKAAVAERAAEEKKAAETGRAHKPAPAAEPIPSLFDRAPEPPPLVPTPAPSSPPSPPGRGPGREQAAVNKTASRKEAGKGPSKVLVIAFVAVLVLAAAWAVQTFLPGGGSVPPPAPEATVQAPSPADQEPVPAKDPETAPAAAPSPVKPDIAPRPAAPAGKVAGKPAAPAGTVAAKTAATAPAAALPSATGRGFFVQVGGAAMKENLDDLSRKLREAGYQPVLIPGVVRGKGLGPVTLVAGPFPGLAPARDAAARVQESGLPAILVRGTGEEYLVKAGSYPSEAAAQPSLAKVKKLGFPARLDGQAGGSAAVRLTLVRVGPYPDEITATQVRDELAGKGFAPILVRP
jgi:hypothetical protein